jgi:hypothetical protein
MTAEQKPHLPSPSLWPFMVGSGVALLAFGLPTSLYFSVAGLVVLAFGIFGWVQELRHE